MTFFISTSSPKLAHHRAITEKVRQRVSGNELLKRCWIRVKDCGFDSLVDLLMLPCAHDFDWLGRLR